MDEEKFDPCCGCMPLQKATKTIAILNILYWILASLIILVALIKIGDSSETTDEAPNVTVEFNIVNFEQIDETPDQALLRCQEDQDCSIDSYCKKGICRSLIGTNRCKIDSHCEFYMIRGSYCSEEKLCVHPDNRKDIEDYKKNKAKGQNKAAGSSSEEAPVVIFEILLAVAIFGIGFSFILFCGVKKKNLSSVLVWIIGTIVLLLITLCGFAGGFLGIILALFTIGIQIYFLIAVFVFYYNLKDNPVSPAGVIKEEEGALESQPLKESSDSNISEN